jgi:hypothetical protein
MTSMAGTASTRATVLYYGAVALRLYSIYRQPFVAWAL